MLLPATPSAVGSGASWRRQRRSSPRVTCLCGSADPAIVVPGQNCSLRSPALSPTSVDAPARSSLLVHQVRELGHEPDPPRSNPSHSRASVPSSARRPTLAVSVRAHLFGLRGRCTHRSRGRSRKLADRSTHWPVSSRWGPRLRPGPGVNVIGVRIGPDRLMIVSSHRASPCRYQPRRAS